MQDRECVRCTYAYTYVASGHVYGREFPSERFNFSTIASPSTIDAPLRTEKKCARIRARRLYTRSDSSLFHISPWHEKNEQMINENRLMIPIPSDITTCVARTDVLVS